jgi:hypothetical protein
MVAGAFLLAGRCEHRIINTEQIRSGPLKLRKPTSEPTRGDPPPRSSGRTIPTALRRVLLACAKNLIAPAFDAREPTPPG